MLRVGLVGSSWRVSSNSKRREKRGNGEGEDSPENWLTLDPTGGALGSPS